MIRNQREDEDDQQIIFPNTDGDGNHEVGYAPYLGVLVTGQGLVR